MVVSEFLPSLNGKLWIPGDNRTGTPPGKDGLDDGGGDGDGDGDGVGDGDGDGDGDGVF